MRPDVDDGERDGRPARPRGRRGAAGKGGAVDVVVVGAGVGGLSAAAELGRAGLSVLVLEREAHAGGTAGCYRRRGFSFPMGPLGFSSPRLVRAQLARLGADDGLSFRHVGYEVRAYGLRTTISQPQAQLAAELKRRFPDEAEGIEGFFALTRRLAGALRSPAQPASAALLADARRTGAAECLAGHIGDPRLGRLLGSLGSEPPSPGLPLLAAMWRLMGDVGIWYPAGGLSAFSERLADAARRAGVGIRLRTPVAAIGVAAGRALGVRLDDGTVIPAAAVVSDADYKTTVLRLLAEERVPEDWRAAVAAARQSASNVQVALGLDARRCDLSAFAEAGRIIYRSPDVGAAEEGGVERPGAGPLDPALFARHELELSLWSREDPALAPPGGAVLVVRTRADHARFACFRPGPGKRVPEYAPYKRQLAAALVAEAERLIPGLSAAVRVLDVATPLTFEERGGRAEGAVAGWSWARAEGGDWRPRELVRTPVEGLYLASYQALSALFRGGVPTALEAGHRAARAVLAGASPLTRPPLPGTADTP